MHATIEELIALHDEDHSSFSPDTKVHVMSCTECKQQLEAIKSTLALTSNALFEQLDCAPNDNVWARVQSSINALPDNDKSSLSILESANNVVAMRATSMQSLTRAVYALAASIAFVGLISVFMLSDNSQNQQTQLLQASVDQLMTNSRGLEQSLQQVVQQNIALSVSNQQAADRLYWRLTYVDQLIQDANPANSEEIKVLWNDRVEALNALNKLYFERDSIMARSEI